MMERPGESFTHPDVADLYQFRPPYPDGVRTKLLDICPRHHAALDIGCGPGKLTAILAPHFERVVGVDPSAAMLNHARNACPSDHVILHECFAEDAPLEGETFDLIVAGASIHWMDPLTLFPRLSKTVSADHRFVVVNGDDAFEPPWQADWFAFLGRWVEILTGEPFEPGKANTPYAERNNRYRAFVDVVEETYAEHTVQQTVEDLIRCEHSRDTFAYHKLGDQAARFDQELHALLSPHTTEGMLTYTVRTHMVITTIRQDRES